MDVPFHPIHEWFARSARDLPEAIALEVDGEVLDYASLDRLSAQVALTLTPRVPAPGARVGLLVERTALCYAAYLAIQRLGAVAVPLNTLFPAARVAAIADSAGLSTIAVLDPAYADLHPAAFVLDRAEVERLDPNAALQAARPACDALAYVLFTSGSTGTPKGVAVTQGNVDSYTRHVVARYEVGPGCRLSQTFDLTFDPSVFDMMAAWSSGATLVVPSRSELMSPGKFVRRAEITHWFSVPSVISLADRLRGLAAGSMPSLRWSLFAGEPLTLGQARAWHRAAPQSTLENIYGPTELTVTCTEYRLPGDAEQWPQTANGSVPIGDAYPAMQARVVDESGERAEEGELVMRGPQRFPGYVDTADNAGRFLVEDDRGRLVDADTGTPAADDLWYRTGDRVRLTDEGLLHLGRLDHQLKLRGYRVELGDIEAQLLNAPGVRDAVVIVTSSPDGDQHLVAVCTGDGVEEDAVLARLGEALPAYMVPRRVLHREEMPLNLNGKIDRGALTRDWEAAA